MASEENIDSAPEPTPTPTPAAVSAEKIKPAKKETSKTSVKDPNEKAKNQKKHDKLVKKAKKAKNLQKELKGKSTEPCKKLPKSKVGKGEEEENKKNRALRAADYAEEKKAFRSSATKKRQARLNPPIKAKRKAKLGDLRSDLREETVEEKGHRKELIYTVYHNMEIELDAAGQVTIKEPESVQKKNEPECGKKNEPETTKQLANMTKREQEPVLKLKYATYEDVSQKVVRKFKAVSDSLFGILQMYQPTEVMLSFNGGKDCTVVLHLLNNFFQMNECLRHIKIPTLYITDPYAFEEVDEFVNDCTKLYNIELIKKNGPMKKALVEICRERPHLKAVFMGCRRTDPYCMDLKVMQATDVGWPPLMRINPIIDWKCRDVWEYMYMYNVPYCSLYVQGYTSIGNKKDTIPNPYLGITDKTTGKMVDYRPGYELLDNDELERAGRIAIRSDEEIAKEKAEKEAEKKAKEEAQKERDRAAQEAEKAKEEGTEEETTKKGKGKKKAGKKK